MILVYTKGGYGHCFADLLLVNVVSNVRFKTGPWGIKGEYVSFLPASISPAVKSFTPFTGLYMARLLINQRNPRTSTYMYTEHLYSKSDLHVIEAENIAI